MNLENDCVTDAVDYSWLHPGRRLLRGLFSINGLATIIATATSTTYVLGGCLPRHVTYRRLRLDVFAALHGWAGRRRLTCRRSLPLLACLP